MDLPGPHAGGGEPDVPVSVGVDKTVTYVLVPSTGESRAWLVDDWQGSYTVSEPVPVPA